MLKTIVLVFLIVSYFYIAVWIYENISEILGIVIGVGIVGIVVEILIDYFNRRKNKND